MEINLNVLADSLKNGYTWVVLIIAATSGIIGGLAHKLTSPPDDKTSIWVYIIVGGVASLAVLYILSPPDGIKLIALSLAAGYGGKAVLDALEARVKTALAQADAAQAKETGKKAIEAGKKAVSMAKNLSQKSNALEKALADTKGQPKEAILKNFRDLLPTDLHVFAAKSPDSLTAELEDLAKKNGFLGRISWKITLQEVTAVPLTAFLPSSWAGRIPRGAL
jgi:hypothetical protein